MAGEPNDAALMMRYRDGDMTAFETLYARHRGPLFRFVLRQIGNTQRTEDVFQEIWARIIRNRASYRPTAKFTTYLYRIARNCVIDQYRKSGRQSDLIVEQPDAVHDAAATTDDPVAAVGQAEIGAALLAAIAALPDEQREAFLLQEEGGLSLEDIGTVTGVNRETVKSRLRYATQKLRAQLRDSLPTPADERLND